MKKPLVSPLDKNADEKTQKLAEFYQETLGFTPNSIFTMMHRPRISAAFVEMNKAVMENKGRVTSSLKRELAYLSSMTAGCRYCEAHAIRAAERYGSEQDRLDHIWDYKTYDAFTEGERAVFDFAIAASNIPNAVDDEIADRLREHWDEGEIVEILGVIALFGYLNRWNDSMGTQLEKSAAEDGEKLLGAHGWKVGKHKY